MSEIMQDKRVRMEGFRKLRLSMVNIFINQVLEMLFFCHKLFSH